VKTDVAALTGSAVLDAAMATVAVAGGEVVLFALLYIKKHNQHNYNIQLIYQ